MTKPKAKKARKASKITAKHHNYRVGGKFAKRPVEQVAASAAAATAAPAPTVGSEQQQPQVEQQ